MCKTIHVPYLILAEGYINDEMFVYFNACLTI